MTDTELKLIRSALPDSPFYVLKTTEQLDSLFLRTKCKNLNITNIAKNKDLQNLVTRMKATLYEEQGVGLAAPQIGISKNIFLFLRIDKPDYPIQVAINPKIISHAEETVCFEGDGCLSIPDESGDTSRYPWIEVEYYDEKGVLVREKLSGYSRDSDFTGVIFQHEFDHLQGVLFTDRIWNENK